MKGGEDEVWSWQAQREMKGRKRRGRRQVSGRMDGENEEMRGEERQRSGVMAGRLPSNLISMVLGVASSSIQSHNERTFKMRRGESVRKLGETEGYEMLII